jgi:ferredoxin-type protein NapH
MGGSYMKRQNIRSLILLLSLLLFPVIFYYLSPYLIIAGALEGTMAGDTITFFVLLLTGLIFGRSFCGWVCPVGGLQEICLISRGWFRNIDFLYQTEHGISLGTSFGFIPYVTYYGVLTLFLSLTLFTGRRGFCHFGCWVAPFVMIGQQIGRGFRLPQLRLSADPAKCSHCKNCNKNCPMSLDVHGLIQKNLYHTECILCGTCIDVCPTKVIRFRM